MGPVSMNQGGYAAGPATLMSPRISFSHGFADVQRHEHRRGPHQEVDHVATADFEFSVRNYAMRPADEIFSKGMLAPLKGGHDGTRNKVTTLRDELLSEEGEESEDVLSGFKSISCRWIERWGTRKNHKFGSEKLSRKN